MELSAQCSLLAFVIRADNAYESKARFTGVLAVRIQFFFVKANVGILDSGGPVTVGALESVASGHISPLGWISALQGPITRKPIGFACLLTSYDSSRQ